MFIDDLIVLGMAVPEEVTDGRRTVCMGGYSPSMGFIRIYPCRPDIGVHRWDIPRIEVERNKVDTRKESWSIVNSNPEWERLNRRVETVRHIKSIEERRRIVADNVSPCVHAINERHDSMGIVRASAVHRAYFANNPQYGKMRQQVLIERPGEWVRFKAMYPVEPRLSYSCDSCKGQHDQKVLEWGAFEWMHKCPDKVEQYWENARLYSPEHDLYLLVGNQIAQRTSFLVINVIPVKRDDSKVKVPIGKQLPLFGVGQ